MLTLLTADANIAICGEITAFCEGLSDIRLIGCVHNGQDALDFMLKEHVDILLLDILLPVLDGLGVLTRLQSLTPDARPCTYVHTAFLDDRLLKTLQRLGVAYCFVKPMKPENIIQRILQLTHAPIPAPADDGGQDDVSAEITRQIRAVGIPAHLHGYYYLRAAIQYYVEVGNPSTVAVTKEVYPHIATQFHTRPPLVERSIRNAIEVAWTRGSMETLHRYFGYTIDDCKGKPTNAEFIAMIADRVRMSMKAPKRLGY